jgi:uncharacterized protein
MRLENSFDVPAPVGEAWRLLNDVPAVVPCMPGAELVEVVSEDAWRARIGVKLGPISMEFLADVAREVVDEAAGRVVLGVKAREAKGRGSSEATIESTISAAGAGSTVRLVTELELRGAVAQHGRGVVAEVAAGLTRQFADCLARKLSQETAPFAVGGGQAATVSPPAAGLRLLLRALWRALRQN